MKSLKIVISYRHPAIRIFALMTLVAPMVAACALGGGLGATVKRDAFTSKEFGVAASPRVSNTSNPPKGGGRYQIGQPYTVRGKTYVPKEEPDYAATGSASWYGADFHGRRTANGEIFSANAITGAHPTLPLPSYVRVTNLENGRSIVVRVNDRGPYIPGRIMDLSHRAADILGYVNKGHTQISAEYVGPAPLEGDDTHVLLASYNGPSAPDDNTRVASAGSKTLFGMAGNLLGDLFSYADSPPQQQDTYIDTAFAAANAMASQDPALQDWAQSLEADRRSIRFGLGIFVDPDEAITLTRRFAILGAVTEERVLVQDRVMIRLTLTRLKPGVLLNDAVDLAQELGLADAAFY